MCSSDFMKKFLFILCVFFMPIEVWSAENLLTKAIEIRLAAEVPTTSDKIVLGDVATIYSKSIHDFQTLSSLVVGQIPNDTKELKIPLSYLRARIKEALPQDAEFSIKAPLQIVFRQEKFGVSAQEIAQEVIRIGKEKGKIPTFVSPTVEAISGLDKLDIYKLSSSKIEPAGEQSNWKGEMNFKVSSLIEGNTIQSWVKLKINWFADAWVANANIKAFQPLSADQFKKVNTDITSVREDLVSAADEESLKTILKSGRAKRTIAAAAPLTMGMLDRKPDVSPGQKLKVIFVSENGLQVSTEGSIIGVGSVGDDVKAKLRSSKKIITGKLVSDSVIEVSL